MVIKHILLSTNASNLYIFEAAKNVYCGIPVPITLQGNRKQIFNAINMCTIDKLCTK